MFEKRTTDGVPVVMGPDVGESVDQSSPHVAIDGAKGNIRQGSSGSSGENRAIVALIDNHAPRDSKGGRRGRRV